MECDNFLLLLHPTALKWWWDPNPFGLCMPHCGRNAIFLWMMMRFCGFMMWIDSRASIFTSSLLLSLGFASRHLQKNGNLISLPSLIQNTKIFLRRVIYKALERRLMELSWVQDVRLTCRGSQHRAKASTEATSRVKVFFLLWHQRGWLLDGSPGTEYRFRLTVMAQ